jgi:hypothetical protein
MHPELMGSGSSIGEGYITHGISHNSSTKIGVVARKSFDLGAKNVERFKRSKNESAVSQTGTNAHSQSQKGADRS